MVILKSCGFKFGRPEANFVFDVSFLVNPWRQKELHGAPKEKIIDFMMEQEGFEELIDSFANLISIYNKLWPNEKLIFAFVCSAGEYRSPAVVEVLFQKLKEKGIFAFVSLNTDSKL